MYHISEGGVWRMIPRNLCHSTPFSRSWFRLLVDNVRDLDRFFVVSWQLWEFTWQDFQWFLLLWGFLSYWRKGLDCSRSNLLFLIELLFPTIFLAGAFVGIMWCSLKQRSSFQQSRTEISAKSGCKFDYSRIYLSVRSSWWFRLYSKRFILCDQIRRRDLRCPSNRRVTFQQVASCSSRK